MTNYGVPPGNRCPGLQRMLGEITPPRTGPEKRSVVGKA